MFEWKNDFGVADPTPQLGIALGLRFIRDALKKAGNNYQVTWDNEGKGFLIVKPDNFGGSATGIVFGDFELLQTNPESLADTFETRVQNAIMTLQQSAYTKRVKNNPKAVTGASQGSTPQA
jgi:hypothetical protein